MPRFLLLVLLAGILAVVAVLSPVPSAADGLVMQQGRYFKWLVPPDWRASETNAGVTLTSPDGLYSASLSTVLRSRGSRTPRDFLAWVFRSVPGYGNVRVISLKNLPNEHLSNQTWQFIEATMAYTDKGLPVIGVWKVGVANYYGLNDAMIVGYHAAVPEFSRTQSAMAAIAKSIVLTNAAGFAGNNTLIRPKNNPLDNSGLIKSGQYRDRVRSKASQAWREGMMGAEPTYDPKTGQTYNSPFGDYNGARGGYVNPKRPDELLERGQPGYPK